MNNIPLVIKLGGAVLSNTSVLQQLFTTIQAYQNKSHRPLIIVHGGGYLVDDLMDKCHLKVVKKEGLRVTPKSEIPLITGALAGTANKLLLAEALKQHLPSVGLCLADGNSCKVTQMDPELGNVGIASVGDPQLLTHLLEAKFLPIISSIGIDKKGELMNVNADQAAVAIAMTLNAQLVLLSDVSGVLDGKGNLISTLTPTLADELMAEGVINGGMLVKVKAAFDAAKELGRPIEVASWRYPEKLETLFSGKNIGTTFCL